MSTKNILNNASRIINQYRQFAKNNKRDDLFPLIDASLELIHNATKKQLHEDTAALYEVNKVLISTLYLYYLYFDFDTMEVDEWYQSRVLVENNTIPHTSVAPTKRALPDLDNPITCPSKRVFTGHAPKEIKALGTILTESPYDQKIIGKLRNRLQENRMLDKIEPYIQVSLYYKRIEDKFNEGISLFSSLPQNKKKTFSMYLQQLRDQTLNGHASHHSAFKEGEQCMNMATAALSIAKKVHSDQVSEMDVDTFRSATKPYREGTIIAPLLKAIILTILGLVVGVITGTLTGGPIGASIGAVSGAIIGGSIGSKNSSFFKRTVSDKLIKIDAFTKDLIHHPASLQPMGTPSLS